nr:hypothetical protein [Rubrobacter marinus]
MPITSASRFTRSPGTSPLRFVASLVCGRMETVNEPSRTEARVRLIPSTQTLPFSTAYLRTLCGAENSQSSASPRA